MIAIPEKSLAFVAANVSNVKSQRSHVDSFVQDPWDVAETIRMNWRTSIPTGTLWRSRKQKSNAICWSGGRRMECIMGRMGLHLSQKFQIIRTVVQLPPKILSYSSCLIFRGLVIFTKFQQNSGGQNAATVLALILPRFFQIRAYLLTPQNPVHCIFGVRNTVVTWESVAVVFGLGPWRRIIGWWIKNAGDWLHVCYTYTVPAMLASHVYPTSKSM